MPSPFHLLDPKAPGPDRHDAFAKRRPPRALGDLRLSASRYQPDEGLVTAVNVALAVGAPLLLTGEPGTGKTQVAYYLENYFGAKLFELDVRSTTTHRSLLYDFDTVGYFQAANDADDPRVRGDFVKPGPLMQAFELDAPSIVLIDEVDKAPRDFPNDLLGALAKHEFFVPEDDNRKVSLPEGLPPPLVVITSNSERRLPEPFLRRCIFHNIVFDDALVRRAVDAWSKEFPDLSDKVREAAITRFLELRDRGLRKKPSTAELLVWLTALSARGRVTVGELRDARLEHLPCLEALIKDRDDRDAIR